MEKSKIMCIYCHLHVHSAYSEDAVNSPYVLCKTAKELQQTALALTEHGSMASAVEFAQAAKMTGIKGISGCEFYISVNDTTCHITALGNGKRGYNNLVKILNNGVIRAYNQGKTSKRTYISIDDLIQYSEDVILLSGCPNSPVQVKNSSQDEAISIISQLKDIFDDRLFIEAMLAGESESGTLTINSLERSLLLSHDMKIPLVVTCDSHYARPEDRNAHQFVMKSVGYTYNDEDLYLKDWREILVTAKKIGLDKSDTIRIIQGIRNAKNLADKLEGLEFKAKPQLPIIEDADEKLYKAAHIGLETRASVNNWSQEQLQAAKERLEYELGVLKAKQFSTYILLTNEFLDVGRKSGMIGFGRGSAAGSMVCYALQITEVNPLEADTLFERFINPLNDKLPDIDNDGGEKSRDSIVQYAIREYNAIPIATYSYHSHRALINDLEKIYGIPEELAKRLREDEPERNKDGELIFLDNEAWEDFESEFEEAFEAYLTCLDQNIRHGGKHAAGIILKSDNADYEIPLTLRDGVVLAEFSEGTHGQNLGSAGGVKFDILGLKTLDVVERVLKEKNIQMTLPNRYDYIPEIAKIGENTKELDGVFQLSGSTALNYARRFHPRTLEDVTLITSLARTGSIKSGASEEFLNHRQKSGYPKVKAIPPYDKGQKAEIKMDNGLVCCYYTHWQIMLADGKFKKISELEVGDALYEEK